MSDDVLDRAGFSQEGEEHGLPLPYHLKPSGSTRKPLWPAV
ncbi:hypothetical protein [Streptomyces echinatus]